MRLHLCFTFLFYFIGVLKCKQTYRDVNRIKRFPDNQYQGDPYINFRHSLDTDSISGRGNDYKFTSADTRIDALHLNKMKHKISLIKKHEPKEDPKLFYQSETYLQEARADQKLNEVAEIYPGREVVYAIDMKRKNNIYFSPSRYIDKRNFHKRTDNKCIKCPVNRILMVKPGSDSLELQSPTLTTCSGKRPPKNIHLIRMYGPTFGSLIRHGSHYVIGKIVLKKRNREQILQTCKMQIQVIHHNCSLPDYLKLDCHENNRICDFKCKDSNRELVGDTTALYCDNDLKWIGTLPQCKGTARPRHCIIPPPPNDGSVSCKGRNINGHFSEGSRCRALCNVGWRRNARASICHRGVWTNLPSCLPKIRKNINNQ